MTTRDAYPWRSPPLGARLVVLWVTLGSLLGLVAREGIALAAGQPRGYTARACGFDLDGDGVHGEPTDDCNVCDAVTADPDGDGVTEDQIYVDCARGSDVAGCGTPGTPCASIGFAWNTIADGPSDGAEDIVCFRATCSEAWIRPGVSGLARTHLRPKAGSEVRDWAFPADPTMLVGWDTDNDGAYPPFDPDDDAVLDGTGLGEIYLFDNNHPGGADYLEVAHFTAREIATGTEGGFSGFWLGRDQTNVYFHDLSLRGVNKDGCVRSSTQVFNMFDDIKAMAVENIECRECGGYFARGSGAENDLYGPLRFQNISYTAHGADDCSGSRRGGNAMTMGFKLWGYYTDIEILDNVFDYNIGAWAAPNCNGCAAFAGLNHCAQNGDVVNNLVLDFRTAFNSSGGNGSYCNAPGRRTTGIRFDRNEVRYGNPHFGSTIFLRATDDGDNPNNRLGTVTFSNNLAYNANNALAQRMLEGKIGSTADFSGESINVVNNSFCSSNTGGGFEGVIFIEDPKKPHQMENLLIKNNIIACLPPGARNTNISGAPTGLDMDFNVFDRNGTYKWGSSSGLSLQDWRAITGGDQSSRECVPAFVDPGAGDLHLTGSDSCARDSGTDLSHLTCVDMDGGLRGLTGVWDIGADELGSTVIGGCVLFVDSFESGDPSSWSTRTP